MRPEVAKEGMQLGQVSKELARLWAETGEGGGEERQKYQDMAAADKERYEKELAETGVNGRTARAKPASGRKSTKKAAKTTKVPRAPSAYMLFCQERRPALTETLKASLGPGFKYTVVMTKLGEEWRELSDGAKVKYQDMAAAEKAKAA